ncbi:MAG: preprotein translocase subunit YajC [candidate division NC10 bacterium]
MSIAHAADLAYAAVPMPGGSGSGSAMVQILFLAALFAIFYFLLIRPQQRQRRQREAMLNAVKRGDKVVTSGGLHGTVVGLNEHTVVLKVADQVKLEFDRSAIGRVVAQGEKEGA